MVVVTMVAVVEVGSSHNSGSSSIGGAKSKECDKNNPPSRRNLAIVF